MIQKHRALLSGGLVVLLALVGRIVFESRREFHRGELSQSHLEIREAIAHFDRSVHWYAPFNPYVGRSLTKLWEIGAAAEATDPKLALFAYDAMRGGIYGIRHVTRPYAEWLPKVNERIAQLRAQEQVRDRPGTSFDEALAYHRTVLTEDRRPKLGWALLSHAGFLGWILLTFLWISRGLDETGRICWRRSRFYAAGSAGAFLIWMIGLANA